MLSPKIPHHGNKNKDCLYIKYGNHGNKIYIMITTSITSSPSLRYLQSTKIFSNIFKCYWFRNWTVMPRSPLEYILYNKGENFI